MDAKLKDYLIGEFEIAVDGMRNPSHSTYERMYFMSASFGALARVLNIEYDRRLVFAHVVLQGAHQAVMQLVNQTASGAERAIQFHPPVIDSLADLVEEVGHQLAGGESIADTLEKIAEVAYGMGGNGHYLYRKGIIQLAGPRPEENSAISGGNEPLEDDSAQSQGP